ncbi:hypothetical protein OJAV_G00160680 [Oryzias javanicus]|uniref:Uncharacterized protein n=1 Tax=Oryzias javanicus TaxID=123683 RepID=A0A3S2MMF4_ORYJA|nr:hypothetical protein OJAV_G00160680 [Oryzias javanicus]
MAASLSSSSFLYLTHPLLREVSSYRWAPLYLSNQEGRRRRRRGEDCLLFWICFGFPLTHSRSFSSTAPRPVY